MTLKYELITAYKIPVNDINVEVYFYYYTGIYFCTCSASFNFRGTTHSWRFFLDKTDCYNSINALKKNFYSKKLYISKQKKYNIELTPMGDCFFDCPSCDANLYFRNIAWKTDSLKCVEEGIDLKIDNSFTYKYRDNTTYTIYYDLTRNVCIQNVQDFSNFVYKFILSGFDKVVYCDSDYCSNREDYESYLYHSIYFCKICNDVIKEQNQELSIDCSCDDYNLCKECFNEENIRKHADEYPGHTEFILKEEQRVSFVNYDNYSPTAN